MNNVSAAELSGVLAPVVTPFKSDLMPDPERLLGQCRWLLSQDCGLAFFGTNSEANSLSVEEREELLEYLVGGGIDPNRMMPGTGACSISDAVRLTSLAVRRGCAGVLMLPPFYYKGVSDDGLFNYFSTVIERVADQRLRIYVYHIPQVSHVPISLGLIERLLEAYPGTVVGVKDSSGDWSNTQAMLDRFPGFRVFAGSENFLLQNMRHGGAGCISATANINPGAIHALYANWRDEKADEHQASLTELRETVARFPMIPALKSVVAHFSDDDGWVRVRPPLIALDSEQRSSLAQQVETLGFAMPGLRRAA